MGTCKDRIMVFEDPDTELVTQYGTAKWMVPLLWKPRVQSCDASTDRAKDAETGYPVKQSAIKKGSVIFPDIPHTRWYCYATYNMTWNGNATNGSVSKY